MLEVKNISFSYGDTPVLKTINLNVNRGEIICLPGESGSGKTTLLRVIAGLESEFTGDILVDDQSVRDIPVYQRGFGLMFQDFALFPHMNVSQNVAFGLRMKGIDRRQRDQIVNQTLNLVGLSGYEKRDIASLSGGQKQRVALARSLAPQPRLLLLDEPLGSLDAGLRERLVLELRDIIKDIGLTALYVTHDQHEAYSIADKIALMNKGHIEQFDTPENLYSQPVNAYVARFLGLNNIVSGDFLRQLVDLSSSDSFYLIHPENLKISIDGQMNATVLARVFQGDRYRLRVVVEDFELTLFSDTSLDAPQIGDSVRLALHPGDLHRVDD